MIYSLQVDTNNSYKALGQFLRISRIQKGLSLRDLGVIANVSHTLIANIEQGKVTGSNSTIKELFNVLEITFHDDEEFINEFVHNYNITFDYLFKYEYTRAKTVFKKMMDDEMKYKYSVLVTDYALLKFFYLVLLGETADDGYIDLSVLRKIYNYLSDSQKQLFLLIEGIDYYNNNYYKDAENSLKKALMLGNSTLDHLVNVFLVKCYVKMYSFMKVIKIGNATIDYFEESVIYLRAMEVRLSIAYSHILVRNFTEAQILLDRVSEFSLNFNAIYLMKETNLLLGSLALLQEKVDLAQSYFDKINNDEAITAFLKVRIHMRRKEDEKILFVYNTFMKEHNLPKDYVQRLVLKLTVCEYGLIELDEEQYVNTINELIEYGIKACNIEVIDSSYNFLIRHYTKHRMYKRAYECSEKARAYRKYGCLIRNQL